MNKVTNTKQFLAAHPLLTFVIITIMILFLGVVRVYFIYLDKINADNFLNRHHLMDEIAVEEFVFEKFPLQTTTVANVLDYMSNQQVRCITDLPYYENTVDNYIVVCIVPLANPHFYTKYRYPNDDLISLLFDTFLYEFVFHPPSLDITFRFSNDSLLEIKTDVIYLYL